MTTTGYQLQTAVIGQQLLESDYNVHELPACDEPSNELIIFIAFLISLDLLLTSFTTGVQGKAIVRGCTLKN